MGKVLGEASLQLYKQTNCSRLRKTPELEALWDWESTWEQYHTHLPCSHSSWLPYKCIWISTWILIFVFGCNICIVNQDVTLDKVILIKLDGKINFWKAVLSRNACGRYTELAFYLFSAPRAHDPECRFGYCHEERGYSGIRQAWGSARTRRQCICFFCTSR